MKYFKIVFPFGFRGKLRTFIHTSLVGEKYSYFLCYRNNHSKDEIFFDY